MILKSYDPDLQPINYEIACTPAWERFILGQNKNKSILECGLQKIEDFQKLPKFFDGHHISEYCLYMGSYISKDGEKYDLYAHREENRPEYYGTGIVFGHEDSDYLSGWPMSLLDERFEVYSELFWRLYVSNLITEKILAQFFECTFNSTVREKERQWRLTLKTVLK